MVVAQKPLARKKNESKVATTEIRMKKNMKYHALLPFLPSPVTTLARECSSSSSSSSSRRRN